MRLIDADAVRFETGLIDNGILFIPYRDIAKAPTIDAEPIRHGHWDVVTVGTNFHTDRLCRNCKKTIKSNYWCYCPNCGAKMDEVSG